MAVKNMTLPVAVAVAIIGCVLAVSANVTTSKMYENVNQERYKRMLAEEHLQKAQTTIKKLQAEIEDSRNKIQSIQEILNVGQSARENLKAELTNAAKEKESLRNERELLMQRIEQLQQAVATQGAPKPAVSP